MSDSLIYRGSLAAHKGWVTCIATSSENPDMLVSGSRDKTLIVWSLTREDGQYGYPKKILTGHSHFVSDVALSSDGQFALSSSWDKTLRLHDLNTGTTTRRFVGHTGDVLSVSFSADNRQIVSSSRDRTIKLWNTLGECKFNITEDGHSEWVSCVRFSPNPSNPVIVSAGWDKVVKVSLCWQGAEGKRRGRNMGCQKNESWSQALSEVIDQRTIASKARCLGRARLPRTIAMISVILLYIFATIERAAPSMRTNWPPRSLSFGPGVDRLG